METIKHKFQKIKNIYHLGQAILANFIYGFPARRIHPVKSPQSGVVRQEADEFNGVKVIGVTGTNGKTTTVWMIGKILEEAGFKVAINSTINFQIGAKKWVNRTKFTTLSSFAVQKFIKEAVREKCDYLALETSSHSLDQFRVWGIPYAVAVITNVTREHLDYHQTMAEYRKAKSKLFKNLKSNFQFSIHNLQSIFNNKNLEKNKKVSIVNLDMENPGEFLNFAADEKYAYSAQNHVSRIMNQGIKFVEAKKIELGINSSKFIIHNSLFTIHLPGKFNVENALAATCVGLSQNINLEIIQKALEKIQGIPGRMEYVPNNKGLNIIIDYAVTPDSLEKLYDLIKTIRSNSPEIRVNSRVIAVFGSCGERDRGKRPIMGGIVARYADYIILTNEDPYNEDPQRIIDEVFKGIMNYELRIKNDFGKAKINNSKHDSLFMIHDTKFVESENCWRIPDRREAIEKALQLAQLGDFVIITGKGAEEIMAIGKKRIPWNEKTVIEEELKKI